MKWPLCRLKVNIICQWNGAGVQCLQCISNGDTAVQHEVIDPTCIIPMYSLFCYITIIFIIISFLVFSILFIILFFFFPKFLLIIYWILYLLIVIIIILFPFPKLNYNNYFNYFHITFSPHSLIFFPSLIVITHANVYECPTSRNLYVVYVLQGDQLDKPCFSGILK